MSRTVPATSAEDVRRWREAWDLARVLDSGLRIPGTTRRVGWDGIMGLVPGVGDAAGLALSGMVIARGVKLGAGGWTLARMVVVALIDALVGALPFVGWLFDFVFKANERNLRTLERHGVDADAVDDESRRIVLTALAVGTVAVVTVGTALVAVVSWLIARYT